MSHIYTQLVTNIIFTTLKQSKHRDYFYVKVDGYNESISKIKFYCDKNANIIFASQCSELVSVDLVHRKKAPSFLLSVVLQCLFLKAHMAHIHRPDG